MNMLRLEILAALHLAICARTSVDLAATKTQHEYSLLQNYPNPFNPTTVIRSHLSVAGEVRLVVYDILGREVAVLMDERTLPGSHEVTFDRTRLASGVYFYRMQAGEFVEAKRLMMLK